MLRLSEQHYFRHFLRFTIITVQLRVWYCPVDGWSHFTLYTQTGSWIKTQCNLDTVIDLFNVLTWGSICINVCCTFNKCPIELINSHQGCASHFCDSIDQRWAGLTHTHQGCANAHLTLYHNYIHFQKLSIFAHILKRTKNRFSKSSSFFEDFPYLLKKPGSNIKQAK